MKKLRITINGKTYDVDVEILSEEGTHAAAEPARRPAPRAAAAAPAPAAAPAAAPAPAAAGGEGDVPSPLAGLVVSVDVKVGDTVSEGQKLVTLEAMKMNTIVSASTGGTVKAIHVGQGDAVEEGQSLLSLA